MSDRLILELISKFKNEIQIEGEKVIDKVEFKNSETKKMFEDLQLTLQSLNYKSKEINTILPNIIKEAYLPTEKEKHLSFENLLKLAMNYLDEKSSNLDR